LKYTYLSVHETVDDGHEYSLQTQTTSNPHRITSDTTPAK